MSEPSAYLPPIWGFRPKWRSIPARPWSGIPKIWRRSTFVLIWARGCPGVVCGVMIGRLLLFPLVHDTMLDIEAKQPKCSSNSSFERDHGLLLILNKLGCGKGTSLSSPSVNNILYTDFPAQELAVTKWWSFMAARSSLHYKKCVDYWRSKFIIKSS
jgi:hypothetical protein